MLIWRVLVGCAALEQRQACAEATATEEQAWRETRAALEVAGAAAAAAARGEAGKAETFAFEAPGGGMAAALGALGGHAAGSPRDAAPGAEKPDAHDLMEARARLERGAAEVGAVASWTTAVHEGARAVAYARAVWLADNTGPDGRAGVSFALDDVALPARKASLADPSAADLLARYREGYDAARTALSDRLETAEAGLVQLDRAAGLWTFASAADLRVLTENHPATALVNRTRKPGEREGAAIVSALRAAIEEGRARLDAPVDPAAELVTRLGAATTASRRVAEVCPK